MNICLNCSEPTKNLKFCSKHCSAVVNNKFRTIESRQKCSKKLKGRKFIVPNYSCSNCRKVMTTNLYRQHKCSTELFQFIPEGKYTRVWYRKCKLTNIPFYTNSCKKLIHPQALESKKQYHNACQFNFSLSKYSSWFNNLAELISKYGWYSASNRNNNLNGISRDHMYSIFDGWNNKISPSIIGHPANCKLLSHKSNMIKNKNSSITLNELKQKINEFNSIYGDGSEI